MDQNSEPCPTCENLQAALREAERQARAWQSTNAETVRTRKWWATRAETAHLALEAIAEYESPEGNIAKQALIALIQICP